MEIRQVATVTQCCLWVAFLRIDMHVWSLFSLNDELFQKLSHLFTQSALTSELLMSDKNIESTVLFLILNFLLKLWFHIISLIFGINNKVTKMIKTIIRKQKHIFLSLSRTQTALPRLEEMMTSHACWFHPPTDDR